MSKTDLEKNLDHIVKDYEEQRDFKDDIQKLKYCIKNYLYPKEEVMKDYNRYKKGDKEFIEYSDNLSYEDYKKEYATFGLEDIEQLIDQNNDSLEIISYKTDNNERKIHEITISFGGPNIYLTINTRWKDVKLEGIWGGERVEKNISYLYETVSELYNIND